MNARTEFPKQIVQSQYKYESGALYIKHKPKCIVQRFVWFSRQKSDWDSLIGPVSLLFKHFTLAEPSHQLMAGNDTIYSLEKWMEMKHLFIISATQRLK